eukprot:COSAG06_NODE_58877_length_276_cov_0.271186_1_plen_62_part_10
MGRGVRGWCVRRVGGGVRSVDGGGRSRKPPRPMPNATTPRTKSRSAVSAVENTLFFVNNGAT